jgi:hypothetical protein
MTVQRLIIPRREKGKIVHHRGTETLRRTKENAKAEGTEVAEDTER